MRSSSSGPLAHLRDDGRIDVASVLEFRAGRFERGGAAPPYPGAVLGSGFVVLRRRCLCAGGSGERPPDASSSEALGAARGSLLASSGSDGIRPTTNGVDRLRRSYTVQQRRTAPGPDSYVWPCAVAWSRCRGRPATRPSSRCVLQSPRSDPASQQVHTSCWDLRTVRAALALAAAFAPSPLRTRSRRGRGGGSCHRPGVEGAQGWFRDVGGNLTDESGAYRIAVLPERKGRRVEMAGYATSKACVAGRGGDHHDETSSSPRRFPARRDRRDGTAEPLYSGGRPRHRLHPSGAVRSPSPTSTTS